MERLSGAPPACLSRRLAAGAVVAAFVAAVLTLFSGVASSQSANDFADWTEVSDAGPLLGGAVASGTLHGTPISLSGTQVYAGAGTSTTDASSGVFNSPDFTPPLVRSDAINFNAADGNSYTLTFGTPVANPVLHLASLGSTLHFPAGTRIARLSGDAKFSVSGSNVVGTLAQPDDGRGTVRLLGTFSSIGFTTTSSAEVDGVYLQVGAAPATPPPPRRGDDNDNDNVRDALDNCPLVPNADQRDNDRDGVGDGCDRSDASAGPALGRSVVLRVTDGVVLVRRGRSGNFTPVVGAETLPVGTEVDVTGGRIALTSAASRARTQTATFYTPARSSEPGAAPEGIFRIAQKRSRRPTTDIKLRRRSLTRLCGRGKRTRSSAERRRRGTGALRAPTALAARRRRGRVPQVGVTGSGRFQMIGKNAVGRPKGRRKRAVAASDGTRWLMAERCDGTLIRVFAGSVVVRNVHTGKRITLRAGGSYLAGPKRRGRR